ncbi:MAG: glucuronyl hydrolase [Chitinophagaceae bacterium]
MKLKYISATLVFAGLNLAAFAQKVNVKKAFKHAAAQTALLLDEVATSVDPARPDLIYPRTVEKENLKLVGSNDWTSGFFPGVVWYLDEFYGTAQWKSAAIKFTNPIEKEKANGTTHDLGFMMYCSFGNAYRLTNDPHYKEVVIAAAKTLVTRFNPKTGVIRSWDHSKDKWANPVIIDNMINLELLFEATNLTGDSSFYKIAVSHANTTMKNHFRSDYSSYHVVDFDPITGKVVTKVTHQGFSNESAWARGQAWGLYGYTMCYRYTKDPAYLKQAENIAGFILTHPNMPKDMVPYWDFNAPGIPNEPRDASAAAVLASGLYELSKYSAEHKYYTKKADQILANLSTDYIASPGSAKGFILVHSTGNKPVNNEIDVPINYADYYYLEALIRCKNK